MNRNVAAWIVRAAVGAVFAVNVWCAVAFIAEPAAYAGGFELAGVAGATAVQGFGILFLMWNATYPLVIVSPVRHRALFGVVMAQQAIGVAGETWLWTQLPAGHERLLATGLRFLAFDAAGLAVMAAAFVLLVRAMRAQSALTGPRAADSGAV